MKVIVIGAGLSGLAAAYRLQEAGHEVQVVEADSRPGGRCEMLRTHGFLVDICPEISAASYHRFLAMARNAGLGDQIVECSAVVSTLRNGRMIEIDTRNPLSIVFTPVLSWGAKFRVIWGMFKHRKAIKRADAFSLSEVASLDDPNASAEAFSVKAFGREAADYLIDPLLRPLGGSHMSRLSQLVVLGGVSSWSSALVTLKGGLYRVPEAIAARLKITYHAQVSRVTDSDGGVEVGYVDAAGAAHSLTADKCILATQYDDAARIYPRLAEYAGDYGKHLRFARLMDVKLGYRAPTRSKAFVAQVPTVEDKELLMFCLSHNKAADRAPAGHSLFTLYTDDAVWEQFSALSDDAIIDWAKGRMEKLYPEVKGHFVFGYVGRKPRTACFADPGFYQRTAALLERLSSNTRVQLAGDVFGAGSMEAAVVWGEQAADRLLGVVAE